MIIPMVVAMLINTFCPEILLIGSFTTEGFSNEAATTIMALQLFCIGSQLEIGTIGKVIKRGGVLFLGKIFLGIATLLIIREEFIFGISIVTVLSALTNVNGSIYLSIVASCGDEVDGAASTILALTNGPVLVMIFLGLGGIGEFSLVNIVATVLPIAIGMVIGNLSKMCKEQLKVGISFLIPFIGFSLGAGIKLSDIILSGYKGIVLSIIIVAINIIFMFIVDKFIIKRPGYAGIATCATGVNAITIPASIALINPHWSDIVIESTMHIAVISIFSSIIVPIISLAYYKKYKQRIDNSTVV